MVAETITRLQEHRVSGRDFGIERLRVLKVTRIHAQHYFVFGIAEDLAEVQTILLRYGADHSEGA